MKTRTYTAEMKAYLPSYYSPDALQDASCIGKVALTMGDGRYYRNEGYPLAGTATVTLEIMVDEKDLINSKVESLQARLAKDRAESEVRQNRILEQISKLQALEYTA
jgi:hypothetical protein